MFDFKPHDVWEALGIDVDGLGATGTYNQSMNFRQDPKCVVRVVLPEASAPAEASYGVDITNQAGAPASTGAVPGPRGSQAQGTALGGSVLAHRAGNSYNGSNLERGKALGGDGIAIAV